MQEEIDIYNELLPAVGELSATMFIEIANMDELRRRLPELVGIEFAAWLDAGPHRLRSQGEEGRSTESKTSTVHYLRFAVPPEAAAALADPAQPARIGIDHPHYQAATDLSPDTRRALAEDLALR